MNIGIVGAGITGATAAYILTRRGHSVTVYDSLEIVGGASRTCQLKGKYFEPVGGHTFHTNMAPIVDFVQKTGQWREVTHKVFSSDQEGGIAAFPPPTVGLADNPVSMEEELVQRFGRLNYEKYFKRFSTLQWGVDPSDLLPHEITKRLSPGETYFPGHRQFMPVEGYTIWVETLLSDSIVHLRSEVVDSEELCNRHCRVIWTGWLDDILVDDPRVLPYRSVDSHIVECSSIDWPVAGGTFNVGQGRILKFVNFNIRYEQPGPPWIIGVLYVGDGVSGRQYPVPVSGAEDLAKGLMLTVAKQRPNLIPLGRSGLYQYIEMDLAVLMGHEGAEHVGNWIHRTPEEKLNIMVSIRQHVKNREFVVGRSV